MTDKRELLRGILVGAAIMYVVSPADIMPGIPVDDLIMLLLGLLSQKKLAT